MRNKQRLTSAPVQPSLRKVELYHAEPRGSRVQSIPLTAIDDKDERFQCRVAIPANDLIESIRNEGQQTPIVLWGGRAPFVVIDGFRRVTALKALEKGRALAILRPELGELEAFVLSFCENVRRQNLRTIDKAAAVWKSIRILDLSKEEVARALLLSERQVDRYLAMMNFPVPVFEAVRSARITMAHAVELQSAKAGGVGGWIKRIEEESLSARSLREKLAAHRQRRMRPLLVRTEQGFRLRDIRYHARLPDVEKRRILAAMRQAIAIMEGGEAKLIEGPVEMRD